MYKKILFIVVTFLQSISASSQDLFNAVTEGNAKRLKDIIDSNPDFVNTKNHQGDTPLIWAAARGKYECVIILLSQTNIQVNLQDYYGQTPLMLAAMNGNHKCVDALIGHPKIEVNKQNDGVSAITLAITNGHLKCVASLLKHPKIALNFKYDNGDTVLHTVLKHYIDAQKFDNLTLNQSTYVAMLKLLLKDPRTDITISNADGDTALSLMKSCDLKEVFLQKPEKTYIPTETDEVEENTPILRGFLILIIMVNMVIVAVLSRQWLEKIKKQSILKVSKKPKKPKKAVKPSTSKGKTQAKLNSK